MKVEPPEQKDLLPIIHRFLVTWSYLLLGIFVAVILAETYRVLAI